MTGTTPEGLRRRLLAGPWRHHLVGGPGQFLAAGAAVNWL